MKIKSTDLVLEIGPGSFPYWRSDVLADKFDNKDETVVGNYGGKSLQTEGKPFYKIVDNQLPFQSNSFDYIICSHVFEHVPAEEISILLSEIFRVASRAYIEFPAPLYDIVYGFKSHVNFLDIDEDTIYCLPKTLSSCINENFGNFAMHLREKFHYHTAKGQEEFIAVGKEFFRDHLNFVICEDEESFFNIVKQKTYYCKKASLLWRGWDKLRGIIINKLIKKRNMQKIKSLI